MAKVVDLEDDGLAATMKAGEEAALCTVIEKYTAYVGTIVWSMVKEVLGEADAKEIVSDVFFILWQNRVKIRPGKLKPYLGSIARSKALDALRAAKREVSLEEEHIELALTGPEDELARNEEYKALRSALQAMPEPDRTMFVRHYYYYQSTKTIAERMGFNVKTVQTKLRRGREALRRALTEGGYFIG